MILEKYGGIRMDIKDNLFQSKARFDPVRKVWVVTHTHAGKTHTQTFLEKPKWADSIDQQNAILLQNPDPIKLRKMYDTIYAISLKTFDSMKRRFSNDQLSQYIHSIPHQKDMKDLFSLFKIHERNEEQSSLRSGSMASSQCATMFRYKAITDLLKRGLDRFGPFEWLKNPTRKNKAPSIEF
jgi:hypothetical protein